jgi:hypothetical protein
MWLPVVQLIVTGWLTSAYFGQQDPVRARGFAIEAPASALVPGHAEVEVRTPDTDVYDRPDEASYVLATLRRGERVRVRDTKAASWFAIDPPSATISWIERSSIEPCSRRADGTGRAADVRGGNRAILVVAEAVVRYGYPNARMPGPPAGRLKQGTFVSLLDLPQLKVGRGKTAKSWCAIEPAPDQVCYVRAADLSPLPGAPPTLAETQAAYENTRRTDSKSKSENLPPGIASEIERIEAAHRSILQGQPMERWQLEPVRARYQELIKTASDNPAAEEAIRVRMAEVTQQEQAAKAARALEVLLAESHRRDRSVAEIGKRIAAAARTHNSAYQAVGFIQPSAQKADGRKLYVLIGATGMTVAYLDIPPGLDPDPLLSQRVGVRGSPHYDEDLGTRLITVRALESLESRR